ncbi:HAD hydrolase family protein, partial [Phocaeicola sp. HCN-40430]|uniref:HAD hydrolase family protein n=1 Tax=Phocaeicola sp. HCN-40430 TaxID=3134664 RepID=UPI0030C59367
SENTKIVENRAKKLKIDFLIQGKKNGGKLAAAQEICQQLGITLEEVAYIGDDINCQELLEAVGYAGCPVDANQKIKNISYIYISNTFGGHGCVRDFINLILQN